MKWWLPSLEVGKTCRCGASVPGLVVALAVPIGVRLGDHKGLLQWNSVLMLGIYFIPYFKCMKSWH